ncbi:MAG: UDP-2,3-diacylglucosamine diphosphatase LpxI [Desulfatibacillum sp.]|nr:UDP-2,3-diacylglucosamine diphosphatase LpxI [Desulfatibacillum sp.]
MSQNTANIGIVAGNGQFPLLFTRAARKAGMRVFAAAHINETDQSLAPEVDDILWVKIGQLEKIMHFFRQHGVTRAVMLGGITKARLMTDFEPDALALEVLATVDTTGDDVVLRAVAQALEKQNIEVLAATSILPQLLAPEGIWTERQPTEQEIADIALGHALAKKIGPLDIGQCLILTRGTVVCVEAIEGTDAAIQRAGDLGAQNAVVVKMPKSNQDLRFDLPAAGAKTIETMIPNGCTALAIEAGSSVVFDRKAMVDLANRHNITIMAINQNKE